MTVSTAPVSVLSRAEALLDADRPLDAIDVLLGAHPPTAESVRGLARAVERLDHHRLAARLHAAADELGGPTGDGIGDRVSTLVSLRRHRAALAYLDQLPADLRDTSLAGIARADVYTAMELPALAVDAYGDPRQLIRPFRRRRRRLWWRTGGPIGVWRRRLLVRERAEEASWPDDPTVPPDAATTEDLLDEVRQQRAADGRVAAVLPEADRLADMGEWDKARRRLVAALEVDPDSARLWLRLARTDAVLGRDATVASAAAWRCDLDDLSGAGSHIAELTEAERFREALGVIEALPEADRRHQDIRVARAELYWAMGLRTHALDAYGRPFLLHPWQRRRRREHWWRAGGPIRWLLVRPRRFEENILVSWRRFTRHLPILDILEWPAGSDPSVARNRLDVCILRSESLSARWWTAQRWLGVGSQLIGVLAAGVGLAWSGQAAGLSTSEAVVAATVGTAVAVGVLRRIFMRFARANTWYRVMVRGAPIGIALIGVGYGLLRLRPDNAWVVLPAATLIACAGLAGLYLAAMLVAAWYGLRRARHWHGHAREDALDELLELRRATAEVTNRNDIEARTNWISRLEGAARVVEKRLSAQLNPIDEVTQEWAAHRASGAAAAIRRLKRLVVAPRADSWDTLAGALETDIVALATGRLGDLLWASPAAPAPDPRRRLKWAVTVLRTVAVAAIPIATVLTVDAVFDVDVGVLRWVTLGWAVVYVLIAIDPALKEKIETARATAGLPSPPPDRKEQSSVRSET